MDSGKQEAQKFLNAKVTEKLYRDLTDLARRNYRTTAAEMRLALEKHVEREKAA